MVDLGGDPHLSQIQVGEASTPQNTREQCRSYAENESTQAGETAAVEGVAERGRCLARKRDLRLMRAARHVLQVPASRPKEKGKLSGKRIPRYLARSMIDQSRPRSGHRHQTLIIRRPSHSALWSSPPHSSLPLPPETATREGGHHPTFPQVDLRARGGGTSVCVSAEIPRAALDIYLRVQCPAEAQARGPTCLWLWRSW